MRQRAKIRKCTIACMALMTVLGGCSPPDERLIEMSQQSLDRQAAQNEQMAKQNQQIADTTRKLVEADASAREQMIEAHGELQQGVQAERLSMNQQVANLQRRHDELEAERRHIAQQRQRDPIIASALVQAAALLVCSLPLLFCFCLLRALRQDDCDGRLAELLVEEVLADESMLFAMDEPSRPALAYRPLPLPSGSDATKSESPST